MIRSLPFLTLPFVVLTSAVGQKVEFSIRDLVRPTHHEPLLDDAGAPRLEWIQRQCDPGRESVLAMGEDRLLSDRSAKPWFVPDGLRTILNALTRLGESAFEIDGDVLIVDQADADATRAGLAQLRRQLPPRIALEIKLERRSKTGLQTLMHIRQSVQAGRTETFEDLETRRVVRDYDVEIAQAASSANPVVGQLATGTCLAVRVRVVPGKGELLIELFARVAGEAETTVPPIATLHDGIGPIDRAARQLDESGFAMRVPRGAKRTVGWTAGNGDRLTLTCSGSWSDPKPGPQRGAVVRYRGLFQQPIAEFQTDQMEPETGPAAFAAEAAFRRAGAESVQVVGGGESATAVIVVTGAKADQIDADVASRLARRLRSAELEVVLLDVVAGAVLADVDQQAANLARIEGSVIVGKWVAFSGRTEMRYLRDWDIEVAQSARIPDPKVAVLRHGYQVDARVEEGVDGRFGTVAIHASVVRLVRIDVVRATISRASRAGGVASKDGSVSSSIVLPEDVVGIESPVLKRHSLSALIHLDAKGSAVLRRAAPRLLGEGRELVVLVRVKK